ncbi:MAG: Na+/H+ antiporter NhaC family protein [Bacteroidota bacterium]
MDYGWVSILPPIIAIVLAIWTRQVYISLFLGIWLGWSILSAWDPIDGLARAIHACIDVFNDADNTRVIMFSLLVGALITLMQRSGGVQGFIRLVLEKKLVRSRRAANLFATVVGTLIFVESNITCLITGAVSRPIFDRLKISRERLAYVCDSTSAPVCILIPLNAWGAYVMGLLSSEGIESEATLFLAAWPFDFYAFFAYFLVVLTALLGKDIGPMKKAETRAMTEGKLLADGAVPMMSEEVTLLEPKEGIPLRSRNMLIPVGVMVVMMPIGLAITGQGDLTAGSGSTAVLWGVLAAVVVGAIMYRVQNLLTVTELMNLILKGMGGLVPLATVMMLAFAIGDMTRALGTGVFVASVASEALNPVFIAAIVFLSTAFVAFSTGTSWGTWAVMMPIAIPTALAMDVSLPLTVGAVLSGGIFGDHTSPISDTTLVSSMSAASDHIDHVKTQLPYALIAGMISLALYLIFGMVLA